MGIEICPSNFCYYTSKQKRMQHFLKKILDFPARKKREIQKSLPNRFQQPESP